MPKYTIKYESICEWWVDVEADSPEHALAIYHSPQAHAEYLEADGMYEPELVDEHDWGTPRVEPYEEPVHPASWRRDG